MQWSAHLDDRDRRLARTRWFFITIGPGRSARTRDEMRWSERDELSVKEMVELLTCKSWFGRIGNEVELVKNGVKLTMDGLGLLGKSLQEVNGEFDSI